MRESNYRKVIFVVALVFSTVFLGCKPYMNSIDKRTLVEDSLLLSNIENQLLYFKTIELKAKLAADFIDRKTAIKISIRISNDSIIWMSLNLKSGLPIGKASFTQDSIKIIDRVNNKFYRGNYKQMKSFFGAKLNYDLLQSVITNQIFRISNNKDCILDKRIKMSDLYNSIFISDQQNDSSLLNITYKINKESSKIEKVNILNNTEIIDIDYSEFKMINGKLFPYKILIGILKDGKQQNLNIDISKVNLNKRQRYPFKIIKRFEEVKL